MSDKGVFCRSHGFYDPCPQCTGEEIVWEIPIIDYGVETGVLKVVAGHEEEAFGTVYAAPLPRYRARGRTREIPLQTTDSATATPAPTPRSLPRPRDHVPIGTNPGLLARVKLMFAEPEAT